MNRKLTIVLILVVILLIPLCINSLILCPAIFNFIGEGTDWLLFWGSYLGGAFAALVGFVTLFYSAKRQTTEISINHRKTELTRLQILLSDCISMFNYSKLLTIALYIDNMDKYDSIIKDMLIYHDNIIAKANVWGVIYAGNKQNQYIPIFQSRLEECIRVFGETNSGMQKLIIALKDRRSEIKFYGKVEACNDVEIRKIYNEIVRYIEQHDFIKKTYLQPLFDAAQDWLKNEQNEINKLQNQL